jgi:hypothetical protein
MTTADDYIRSKQPKPRKPELMDADQVPPHQLSWLWRGHLLRGALELISGMPNIGKSQAQISLIASATTTSAWPNGEASGPACNVIMLTAEDTLDEIVIPRLIVAKADLKRVKILKCIRSSDDKTHQFLLSEDLDMLAEAVAMVGNVGLITVDPLTAYMGANTDSHRATDVRSQLGPLKDSAEKIKVAISAITHPPKAFSPRAMDHFIGSQAFVAAARIGHVCVSELDNDKTPTGRVYFTSVKYSASERMPTLGYRIEGVTHQYGNGFDAITLETSRVNWETNIDDITADDAVAPMASKGSGKREQKKKAINDFLYYMLKDGKPVPANRIYAEGAKHDFSEDQLKRAKDKLGNIKVLRPEDTGQPFFSWVMAML